MQCKRKVKASPSNQKWMVMMMTGKNGAHILSSGCKRKRGENGVYNCFQLLKSSFRFLYGRLLVDHFSNTGK